MPAHPQAPHRLLLGGTKLTSYLTTEFVEGTYTTSYFTYLTVFMVLSSGSIVPIRTTAIITSNETFGSYGTTHTTWRETSW